MIISFHVFNSITFKGSRSIWGLFLAIQKPNQQSKLAKLKLDTIQRRNKTNHDQYKE